MSLVQRRRSELERPPLWVSYVTPYRYLFPALFVGAVVGVVVCQALQIPVWIGGAVGGPLLSGSVDIAWRRVRTPSNDGPWSLWARRKYRRRS